MLSLTWSLAPDATSTTVSRMLQLVIFVLLVWEFAVSYQDQLWLLRSLVPGMFVPLGMQLASFGGLSGGTAFTENEAVRYSGGGHDLNYLAMMFAISIVIAIYLASNPSKPERKLRWGYWAYVAAAVLGLADRIACGGYLPLGCGLLRFAA